MESIEISGPSLKNAHLALFKQRAILVDNELFSCRLSAAEPNRDLRVLLETPLVSVSEKNAQKKTKSSE